MSPASLLPFGLAVPDLSDHSVTCVGVRLEAGYDLCARALAPLVSDGERQRAARYVHAIDAARHLLGRFVVRSVLVRALGRGWVAEELQVSSKGKPVLSGSGIDFSISHSGSWVWVAFCREAAVGIDVEEVRRLEDLDDLINHLHPSEAESIRGKAADDVHAAFFRCWTRKEALLKAVGEGLSRKLDSFQVATGPASSDWLIEIRDGRVDEWSCFDLVLKNERGCQISLAAKAPGLSVREHVLPIFWR